MAGRGNVLNVYKARALVNQITDDHGFVSEEDLATMTPQVRERVRRAMFNKDQMIAASIITLAKNLYTSKARFVFELLQNADDNHYTRAERVGREPYVSFQVHPSRIVVECNEDGFTEENLSAICNVGKSSKTGAQAYTGEKGIGFKSVFMVSHKAYIQSGPFSFFFQHRQGDSGMGMISPIWQELEQPLAGPLTRITLSLNETIETTKLHGSSDPVMQQFSELEDTLLLFLRRLSRLEVRFFNSDGVCILEKVMSKPPSEGASSRSSSRFVELQTTRNEGEQRQKSEHFYAVTEYPVTDLPRNENRSYTDDEENSRAWAKSALILAFPLTKDHTPIIGPQDIFAFLPLHNSKGFKFLVQADFVTQANRQDIVTTSLRNWKLISYVGEAFLATVYFFCEHPTLRYQWMRYLPQTGDYPWDGFWKRIMSHLGESLFDAKILFSRSERRNSIRQLQRCAPDALDKNGDPLLPDLNDVRDERYLSKMYQAADLNHLKVWGLSDLTLSQHIERLAEDLKRRDSRMRSPDTDDDWHARAARLFSKAFDKSSMSMKDELLLQRLELIPISHLSSITWTSSVTSRPPLSYPEVDGIPIPPQLPLRLIDSTAARHPERKRLFDCLRVKDPNVATVRRLIFEELNKDRGRLTLEAHLEYLSFLYRTHDANGIDHAGYAHISVITRHYELRRPKSDDVYLANNHPYGPYQLLKPGKSNSNDGESGYRGFKVDFLHRDYKANIPAQSVRHSMTWTEWLHECLGIRQHLRLTRLGAMTPAFEYIAGQRAGKVIGTLQSHWQYEREHILDNQELIRKIGEIAVPTEKGVACLSSTCFPVPELLELCSRFAGPFNMLHFLKLESPVLQSNIDEWRFLSVFGVGFQDDLSFYMNILPAIISVSPSNTEDGQLAMFKKVADLYQAIQGKLITLEESLRKSFLERVRNSDYPPILLPKKEHYAWAYIADCRWDAPDSMQSFSPLGALYNSMFREHGTDFMTLQLFFTDTLGVPNCSWEDFIGELKHLRKENCQNYDYIKSLYSNLKDFSTRLHSIDKDRLKASFQESPLIFVSTRSGQQWRKATECVWSSPTQLPSFTALDEQYPKMKKFFVDFIGVKTLTLRMIYDELKAKASSVRPRREEIYDLLWQLNSYLSTGTECPEPGPLVQLDVFPVLYPSGDIVLSSKKQDFGIVDHKILEKKFRNQLKLLAFTLPEVRRLEPLLKWAGLESRYLSKTVEEITSVNESSSNPISNPERDIRKKGHALYRIAVNFNSPRFLDTGTSLLDKLCGARVLKTDRISSQLRITQSKSIVTVDIATSELHIEDKEDESGLRIYVPRDVKLQELCYCSKLPQQLSKWLMADTSTPSADVVAIVTSVITARHYALPGILDSRGIVEVDIPDPYADSHDGNDGSVVDEVGATSRLEPGSNNSIGVVSVMSSQQSQQSHSPWLSDSESRTPSSSPPLSSDHQSRQTRSRIDTLVLEGRTPPYGRHFGPNQQIPGVLFDGDENVREPYLNLLGKVLQAARGAVLPSHGAFDMHGMLDALSTDDDDESGSWTDPIRVRSISQLERDKKIGAAGELFVFEMLSQLDPPLPSFSRTNWQSTIRKYVSIHPQYHDMGEWIGQETADITYHDRQGTLTDLLIDKGYLTPEVWHDRRPFYFIEVKSTTGPCNTPFFMSKAQVKRMKDHSNGASGLENQDVIYLIARVFNLGKDSIRWKLYVDPEVMRCNGKLLFTAGNWSVKPALG